MRTRLLLLLLRVSSCWNETSFCSYYAISWERDFFCSYYAISCGNELLFALRDFFLLERDFFFALTTRFLRETNFCSYYAISSCCSSRLLLALIRDSLATGTRLLLALTAISLATGTRLLLQERVSFATRTRLLLAAGTRLLAAGTRLFLLRDETSSCTAGTRLLLALRDFLLLRGGRHCVWIWPSPFV